MRLALIAVVAACSASGSRSGAPPSHTQDRAEQERVRALARRADAALDTDTPLDYDRPMVFKPRDRAATRALFVEACKAGDHPSCWKALLFAGGSKAPEISDLVARNCMNGDMMSCRALPLDWELPKRYPHAPGAQGRSEACVDFPDGKPNPACNQAVLRRECEDGFVQSCRQAKLLELPVPNLEQRMAKFELEDCLVDIAPHCNIHNHCQRDPVTKDCTWDPAWSSPQTRDDVTRRACRFQRNWCAEIADDLDKQGKRDEAQRMREVACQYGSNFYDVCLNLSKLYLDHTYVEPVAGRGKALRDYVCASLKKYVYEQNPRVFERYPECKRVSKSSRAE
jgi:hypothetical protein